jgi:hypothetical protein
MVYVDSMVTSWVHRSTGLSIRKFVVAIAIEKVLPIPFSSPEVVYHSSLILQAQWYRG